MHVTAKVDYAVRAMVELAHRDTSAQMDQLAEAQEIPPSFLRGILAELRRARLLASQSGPGGGNPRAPPPSESTDPPDNPGGDGPGHPIR
ncbi:MAG TPA: Rrf2 family transcriptional regulator [Microthrixaceae bacterium]|nr:Rrf2 family transcriptional regulator [Microthrixaceae bacterium]